MGVSLLTLNLTLVLIPTLESGPFLNWVVWRSVWPSKANYAVITLSFKPFFGKT